MRSFHPHPIVAILKIFLTMVALSFFVFNFRSMLGSIYLLLIIVFWIIALFFMLMSFVSSRTHTITLDENTISYRSGVLATRNVVLSYGKITEASYFQGPIQRIFGVGTLNVDTAGGSDIAIRVNDIRHSDVKQLLGNINAKGMSGDGT